MIGWSSSDFAFEYKFSMPEGSERLGVKAVAQSPDGSRLAIGGRRGVLALWNVHARSLSATYELPAEARGVAALRFLPSGGAVAVLCDDGVLRVVDVTTGRVAYSVGGPGSALEVVDVSPHGRYVVGAAAGGRLHLYDLHVIAQSAAAREQVKIDSGLPRSAVQSFLKQKQFSGQGAGTETVAALRKDKQPTLQSATIDTLFPPKYFPGAPSQAWTSAAYADAQSRTRDSHVVADLVDSYAPGRGKGGAGSSNAARDAAAAAALGINDMDPASAQLNYKKLRTLLLTYGEFPDKYRLLAWRFLLGLPGNAAAYANLVAKGTHLAYTDLAEKYPIQSRRLFGKLQQHLSALAYWSPIFGEASYLPALVYPFVKLFEHDDVSGFEVMASALINYCGNWFEFHPNPPLDVLESIESLLDIHAPDLLAHFVQWKVPATEYAWPLLSTFFTEVLTRAEWLKAFDHVFTNEPSFLVFLAAAYLISFTPTLTAIDTAADFGFFFHRHNACDVNAIIQTAYRLAADPKSAAAAVPSPDYTPLPRGGYPIFNRYPTFIVDFQAKEHARIRMAEEAYLRKKETIAEIQRRCDELEAEEAAWRRQQEQLVAAEEERRNTMASMEAETLSKRAAVDAEAREQRLRQIKLYEAARKDFLEQQRALRAAEAARLEDEIKRKNAEAEYELRSRAEEENLLRLEFASMQRMQEMEAEREREASARALRSELTAREKQDALDDRILAEAWALEDEERRLRQRLARERREKMLAAAEEARLKRELDEKYRLAELEKEFKLNEVMRERRLRQLAEDEVERIAADVDDKAAREEILLREEQRELRALLADKQRWREARADERARILERERRKQALELEMRRERLSELEKAQRRRDYEEALEAKTRAEEKAVIEEEKELQRVLLALDEERHKDRQLEEALALKERELAEKLAFQSELTSREEAAVAEERARFNRVRDEVQRAHKRKEAELIRQHNVAMMAIAMEREAALAAAERKARERAEAEELARLDEERAAFARQVQEREAVFEQEAAHIARVAADTSSVSDSPAVSVAAPSAGRPPRSRYDGGERERERERGRGRGASHVSSDGEADVAALLARQREHEAVLERLKANAHGDARVDALLARQQEAEADIRSLLMQQLELKNATDLEELPPGERDAYIRSLKRNAKAVLEKHNQIRKKILEIEASRGVA